MLSNTIEYSEAEKKLIHSISPHRANVITKTPITPYNVYMILGCDCFVENRTGPGVEALRKVCRVLMNSEMYRMTSEFDKLCEF